MRRLSLLHGLSALLLTGGVYLAVRFFPVIDSITAVQDYVSTLGVAAPLVFPLIYALCNILLLPAGILGLAGGFLFGLWWGFLIVLTGNMLGAAGAFLIGRYLARNWIERLISRRPQLQALDTAIENEGWKMVALSQVHPLFPTSLLNYLYGLTRISFWKCMLWVAIGQAPGLFLYAYLGTLGQFGVALLQGGHQPSDREVFCWIAGLVFTFVITFLLGRLALRILAAAQPAD